MSQRCHVCWQRAEGVYIDLKKPVKQSINTENKTIWLTLAGYPLLPAHSNDCTFIDHTQQVENSTMMW